MYRNRLAPHTFLLALVLAALSAAPMGLRFGAHMDDWIRVLLHLQYVRLSLSRRWWRQLDDSLLTPACVVCMSNLRVRDADECLLAGCAIGAVLGAYVGALPIPLDWDRPWQVRNQAHAISPPALPSRLGSDLVIALWSSSNGRSRACTACWSATPSAEASVSCSVVVLAGSPATRASNPTTDTSSSVDSYTPHKTTSCECFVTSFSSWSDGECTRSERRAL